MASERGESRKIMRSLEKKKKAKIYVADRNGGRRDIEKRREGSREGESEQKNLTGEKGTQKKTSQGDQEERSRG